MLSALSSATLFGISAIEVSVEVFAQRGVPQVLIVGLPDMVVKESIGRIKAAIRNSQFEFPPRKITINLAPADILKEGPLLDLAISIGMLQATGQLPSTPHDLFIGELSLSGEIKPIHGILCICELAKQLNIDRIFLPQENLKEASLISGLPLIGVTQLRDVTAAIEKNSRPSPRSTPSLISRQSPLNFDDVKGQLLVKRALQIAAAGHHNVLMIGPPGSGKTMLAKRLPSLLQPLSIEEAIESYKLHSITTMTISSQSLTSDRPFRAPHHSISYAGMAGGGTKPKPGEISLAHHGILFLDELAEFSRQVLEILRQPLESKEVTLSRANFSITYPASFLLIAAMNPCPCGYYMDLQKECTCTPHVISRYWKKVSGPILDRIDIIIDVPRLTSHDFTSTQRHLSSEVMNDSIKHATSFQQDRQRRVHNGLFSPKEIKQHCIIDAECQSLLSQYVETGKLTGRSHDKILKIARTIADFNTSDSIKMAHILEALQFRQHKYGS